MEYLSVDLAIKLPESTDGYIHALIVVDGFSKWVEVLPLKDRLSKTVARAFLHGVVSRYGVPVVVWSDKGNEFRGQFDDLDSFSERFVKHARCCQATVIDCRNET